MLVISERTLQEPYFQKTLRRNWLPCKRILRSSILNSLSNQHRLQKACSTKLTMRMKDTLQAKSATNPLFLQNEITRMLS